MAICVLEAANIPTDISDMIIRSIHKEMLLSSLNGNSKFNHAKARHSFAFNDIIHRAIAYSNANSSVRCNLISRCSFSESPAWKYMREAYGPNGLLCHANVAPNAKDVAVTFIIGDTRRFVFWYHTLDHDNAMILIEGIHGEMDASAKIHKFCYKNFTSGLEQHDLRQIAEISLFDQHLGYNATFDLDHVSGERWHDPEHIHSFLQSFVWEISANAHENVVITFE